MGQWWRIVTLLTIEMPMSLRRILGSALLILSVAATAAQADSRHRDHDDDDDHRHRYERRHDDDRRWRHSNRRREFRCPPGLVEVNRECLRPGHARKDRYYRVGDRFYADGYRRVPDPRRYNLQQGNWQYYQDGNSIYQVDSKTQKIMNVMNMLQLLQMLQR